MEYMPMKTGEVRDSDEEKMNQEDFIDIILFIAGIISFLFIMTLIFRTS